MNINLSQNIYNGPPFFPTTYNFFSNSKFHHNTLQAFDIFYSCYKSSFKQILFHAKENYDFTGFSIIYFSLVNLVSNYYFEFSPHVFIFILTIIQLWPVSFFIVLVNAKCLFHSVQSFLKYTAQQCTSLGEDSLFN